MLHIAFISLLTGFLAHFICNKCMDEGMIFEWYHDLIMKLPDVFYKPLGGCVFCFGTWLNLAFQVKLTAYQNLFIVLLGIGVNYIGTLIAIKLSE